jgi:hypothetical protein
MKTWILVFGCLLALASCKKETPTTMLDEMIGDTAAVVKFTGRFENGPYGTVMGTAHILKLHDGKFQLQLKDFNSSNGPDLKVYLSKERMPVNFINLGDLKSTNGNQLYDILNMVDVAEYKYVCVHCKAFNHLFGSALLQ